MPDPQKYVPTYQPYYQMNLNEIKITYADSSTLECAALYADVDKPSLSVFLSSILHNILSGTHRDMFFVPGTTVEIARSEIRSIVVTCAKMKG